MLDFILAELLIRLEKRDPCMLLSDNGLEVADVGTKCGIQLGHLLSNISVGSKKSSSRFVQSLNLSRHLRVAGDEAFSIIKTSGGIFAGENMKLEKGEGGRGRLKAAQRFCAMM